MSFFFTKTWYGASPSAKMPRIVRSTRSLTGRISHSTVAWPLSSPAEKPNTIEHITPVAGCIGIQESLTMWLETPFTSKGKAVNVLPSMLDVQLPFPLDDCCYCFARFRRTASRTISVLAVATRRATIQKSIDQYKACGIDPVVIDHEGLALWRESLRENVPRSEIIRVIINLEADHVSFVIGSGNIFQNAHSMQMPDASGTETKPEEIFQLIHRILCAELQAGQKVEWLFCGALARQPAVINALHRLLSAEWPGPFMVHKSPETFLSRALSSRALVDGDAACNLRQGELTHTDLRIEHKKRSVRVLLLLFVTGLAICAFNLTWQIAGALQFKTAKQEISRLAGIIVPDRTIPYGREVEEARKSVQKRTKDFAPVLNVFAQPLSTRLAEIINTGKNCRLSFTRLNISRDKIIINGTSEDWNYCERLAKLLENTGYKTEMERTEGLDDNLVHFTVKGSISLIKP